MKMIIVGIFDRKAQAFIEMTSTPSIGVAARQFTEAVNKPSESPIYKWPEDFELYELGIWDTESGQPACRTDDGTDDLYEKKLILMAESVKVRDKPTPIDRYKEVMNSN